MVSGRAGGGSFKRKRAYKQTRGKNCLQIWWSPTPHMSRDRASQPVRESYSERRQRNRNSLLRFVFFCVPGFMSRLKCEKQESQRPVQLHHILRLTRKVTIQVGKILRLPRRVALQLHQILRLGYLSKPHFVCDLLKKKEVGQLKNSAPATKTDRPTSANMSLSGCDSLKKEIESKCMRV